MDLPVSKAKVYRYKEQKAKSGKSFFPKAGNLPGHWHAQEADIQLLTPSV